jgi:hypothetical protein
LALVSGQGCVGGHCGQLQKSFEEKRKDFVSDEKKLKTFISLHSNPPAMSGICERDPEK